jgi:hypothetical protein
VVALIVTSLIAAAGLLGVVLYGRRRPVGAPLTWGEALAAGTFAFALMFWCYGVVPHQWLTYAGNEWGWRTDKILVGPDLWFTDGEGIFEYFLPFTVDYEKLRDLVVVVIYLVFLVLQVVMWSYWQNRGKAKPAELPTSTYGRPLVRQGQA